MRVYNVAHRIRRSIIEGVVAIVAACWLPTTGNVFGVAASGLSDVLLRLEYNLLPAEHGVKLFYPFDLAVSRVSVVVVAVKVHLRLRSHV